MIELTRLNGARLAVNSDLILFADAAPDTLLTMVTGEKLIVTESLAEVAALMGGFRARTIAEAAQLCPGGLNVMTGTELPARAARAVIEGAQSNDGEEIDEESAEVMRRRRRADP
ncbi:MAG TPA: flagellar FlbD family protein [Acidobacteriaceae bacterium]|nr:flagellar FlbD family protein [Acidobacteriaceae bacterium]